MSESLNDLLGIIANISEGVLAEKEHNPFKHFKHLGNKSPEQGKLDKENVWSCHKVGPYKQLCIGIGPNNKGWHKKVDTSKVGDLSKSEYNHEYKTGVADHKYVPAFRSGQGSLGNKHLDKSVEGKRHKMSISHISAKAHTAAWRKKHGKERAYKANARSRHDDFATHARHMRDGSLKDIEKKDTSSGINKLQASLAARKSRGGVSKLKKGKGLAALQKLKGSGKAPALSKLSAKLKNSAEAIKAKKAKKHKKKHVHLKGLAAIGKKNKFAKQKSA